MIAPIYSVITVNGDLRTLRRVLHLAVEWGRMDRLQCTAKPSPHTSCSGRATAP